MKKAQSALEYMMTYGWAFLAVLSAIGILYSVGIFDFSNLFPESCVFYGQAGCEDWLANGATGDLDLIISNSYGVDLFIQSALLSAPGGATCTYSGDLSWPSGTNAQVTIPGCGGLPNFATSSRFDGDLTLTFYRRNSICTSAAVPDCNDYDVLGDIIVNVQ